MRVILSREDGEGSRTCVAALVRDSSRSAALGMTVWGGEESCTRFFAVDPRRSDSPVGPGRLESRPYVTPIQISSSRFGDLREHAHGVFPVPARLADRGLRGATRFAPALGESGSALFSVLTP